MTVLGTSDDARIPRRDPQSGEILTVWNGYTTKTHPVTGKEVPGESARRALFDYTNPRRHPRHPQGAGPSLLT